MCGRYGYFPSNFADLRVRWNLDNDPSLFAARYNICPGQDVPVIINSHGSNRIGPMRWGLVPSWAQDEKIGYKMINARSESLAERPAFKELLERRRCLIPSTGFYEWRQGEAGKVPYFIYLKNQEPFAFAGLWDLWRKRDGSKLATCTIVTTAANPMMQPLHPRMPVILQREHEQHWLETGAAGFATVRSLLKAYLAELMAFHPVSPLVNTPVNDRVECTLPVGD
ncbi:MAG: SOS response-associated peptidase [Deltaproteobacteria bacterium]|nr:SOS response-associated peptidase [Deltaproteobacteria bacterium]MBM4297815.1 SOS response-associated peptidase [Deltaproteobacteria bacterium]